MSFGLCPHKLRDKISTFPFIYTKHHLRFKSLLFDLISLWFLLTNKRRVTFGRGSVGQVL